jgi:hypothetical protein
MLLARPQSVLRASLSRPLVAGHRVSVRWLKQFGARARAWGLPGALAVAVILLGLGLRLEHMLTFDGPARGSDYEANMQGVRWTMENQRPFNLSPSANVQVRYQPPLWFAAGAVILSVGGGVERNIAWLAMYGWLARQLLLADLLRRAIPRHRWSILAALAVNAILPISVLTDGKVNPEGLHTSLFMAAVYALWRMEREAVERPQGISWRWAALFGLFAGLAVLTKATGGILMLVGLVALSWHVVRVARSVDWRASWQRLGRPAALAGLVWCAVAGWWVGPNLVRHHHPFPHVWDLDTEKEQPLLAQPVSYRRPLGWLLPFEWEQYMKLPYIVAAGDPRPNFWAFAVTGTWSDFYNRGFCRLQGELSDARPWGVDDPIWGGPKCRVTKRCVRSYVLMVTIGRWISLAAALAVLVVGWRHLRTRGNAGSLVLPTTILLGLLFVVLFALTYPYDWAAVLNPRYLLPVSTPMSACLALAVAQSARPRFQRAVLVAVLLAAIAAVGALLVHTRLG